MPKSLKDIIGPRAGRNVSKDELRFLDDLKVNKKEDPAGNKDDVFNASKVPSEASLQTADPGMRHGYRSLKASSAAYEETVIEQKKKKGLPPEDDRNINGKDYGYSAGAKGSNGTTVPEETQIDELSGKKLANYAKGVSAQIKNGKPMTLTQRINRQKGTDTAYKKITGDAKVNATEDTQIDELSVDTLKSYKKKQLFSKDKSPLQSYNRLVGSARASRKIAKKEKNEEVEIDEAKSCNMTNEGTLCEVHGMKACPKTNVTEVLKKSTPTEKWISDFVHSKNPKFAGKSKKERIQMALGAKYAKMREDVDYEGEMAKTQLKALAAKANALAAMMNDNQQLEAWVQSKLTNAKHDIDAVHDYLTYGEPTKEDAPNDPLMTFPGMNVDTAFGRV